MILLLFCVVRGFPDSAISAVHKRACTALLCVASSRAYFAAIVANILALASENVAVVDRFQS